VDDGAQDTAGRRMIVRLSRETGAEIEGNVLVSDDLAPAEVAAGLLMVLPGAITRVRVWEIGRSVLDAPDADATRVERQIDDAALDEFLRAKYADLLADVATILDLDARLSLILDGAPVRGETPPEPEPEPEPEDLVASWGPTGGPRRSAFAFHRGPGIVPPV